MDKAAFELIQTKIAEHTTLMAEAEARNDYSMQDYHEGAKEALEVIQSQIKLAEHENVSHETFEGTFTDAEGEIIDVRTSSPQIDMRFNEYDVEIIAQDNGGLIIKIDKEAKA